jgi:NhaA family Na+:H+ antiporter
MTLFFFVVGLEIRREIHDGTLSSVRTAALPIVAAAGGVALPALIYLAFNSDPIARSGWAIPIATDIAFAIGVLTLLGKRVPPALRALLLSLAIADDLVAIVVIALFYANGLALAGLIVAAAGVGGVVLLLRLRVRSPLPYLLPGIAIWCGLLAAGIHPVLAGVILGLMLPMQGAATAPAVHLEEVLHPYVAYGVMPLFALANAGVSIGGVSGDVTTQWLFGGIVAGLVLGKPLGIGLAVLAAVKTGVCTLPDRVDWRGIVLVGLLGGIGFTMSVFIATLAFGDPALLAAAKLAVLVASTLAAVLALVFGRAALPPLGEHLSTRGTTN